MRYYSIIIFLVYTLVLTKANSAPHSKINKEAIEDSSNESLDSVAEPVLLDSMKISEKTPDELNSPKISIEKNKTEVSEVDSKSFFKSKNKIFAIHPELSFYNGLGSNLEPISGLLLGFQITLPEENESIIKFSASTTPMGNQQYLKLSRNHSFQINPLRSGYFNYYFKLAYDSEKGLASIVNFQNYLFGLGLGGNIKKNVIGEIFIDALTLKGIGFGCSVFYIF